MSFRVTRSARRQRAHPRRDSRRRRTTIVEDVRGPQLHYVGIDDRGVQLHVVAIKDNRREGWVAIIHAMPTSFTDAESSDDQDTGAQGDTS